MSFWNNLREQILALWARWTLGQRVAISAASVACLAAVIGTMVWATQPDYVVIASEMSPTRCAELAGILDTEKIDYQLNFSATAISVSATDVALARMALQDKLTPEEASDEGSNGMFLFQSPRQEEDQRLRQQERGLEKTLKKFDGIREATVHISRPDESPFTDETFPVTASVVITCVPGKPMSARVAQNMISAVAHAVPGLQRQNITMTDSNGRIFNSGVGLSADLDEQLEYRTRLEAELSQKAEQMLMKARGVRATVQVSVEVDFRKVTRNSKTVDPEAKVKRKESIDTTKQDALTRPPQGIVGLAANALPDPNNATGVTGKSSQEKIETEYDTSGTDETLELLPGAITRMSVAAFVDIQPPSGGNAGAAALQQEQIENIVRAAVGFNPTRDDEIQVVLTPLEGPVEELPIATPVSLQEWFPLLQYVSLGLAALVAFTMGLMMIRRMKPIVIKETVGPGIPLADARRLAAVSEQARAHPDVVASILSAWLNEQEQSEDSGPPTGPSTEPTRPIRGTTIPKAAGLDPARRAA